MVNFIIELFYNRVEYREMLFLHYTIFRVNNNISLYSTLLYYGVDR